MAIIPSEPSELRLFSGVPFDPRYEHSIYWGFDMLERQNAYFDGLPSRNFTDFRHIRKDGEILVNIPYDHIVAEGYNYCCAINTHPYKRWYYFITGKRYVSQQVTALQVELDVIQTYQFDWAIPACFVEREHVVDDTVGANLIDEGLELGEIISYASKEATDLDPLAIVIQSSVELRANMKDPEGNALAIGTALNGTFVDNAYSGFTLFAVHNTENGAITIRDTLSKLDAAGKDGSSIVSMWMYPKIMLDVNNATSHTMYCFVAEGEYVNIRGTASTEGEVVGTLHRGDAVTLVEYEPTDGWYSISSPVRGYVMASYLSAAHPDTHETPGTEWTDTIGSPVLVRGTTQMMWDGLGSKKNGTYTPRNQKLLTFPYKYLYVYNNTGNGAAYHYELFADDVPKFKIGGNLANDGCLRLIPQNYRGYANDNESGLTLTGFPTCAWTQDMYKIWMAQNANTQDLTIQSGTIQAAAGAASAAFSAFTLDGAGVASGANMAYSGYKQIAGVMAARQDKMVQPPQAKGVQSSNCNITLNQHHFVQSESGVTPEYAARLDQYFDMYGYQVNMVKVPEIMSRPMWNYVKTLGCVVLGGIDAEDRRKIGAIFDKGITLWHAPDTMYRYDLAAGNIAVTR